jgi:hypothetical protein
MKKIYIAALLSSVAFTNLSALTPTDNGGVVMKLKGKVGAAWFANLYSQKNGAVIDTSFARRHSIGLINSSISMDAEGGCSSIAYGLSLGMDAAFREGDKAKGTIQQGHFGKAIAWGRFANMVEIRIGQMKDALGSGVDATSVAGGTDGYD